MRRAPRCEKVMANEGLAIMLESMFAAGVVEGSEQAAVAALELIGVPAAVIDACGRLRQANGLFAGLTGQSVFDRRDRLQWADPKSDLQYRDAVAALAAGRPGRSIVMRRAGEAPIAMHVLPIRGSARDIFQQSAAILILASGAAKSAAAPILLQALFDLSPAEARVVSLIGDGRRPAEIGKTLKLSDETVRSHLKSAFLKTNTNRQSELAALVSAYATPGVRGS